MSLREKLEKGKEKTKLSINLGKNKEIWIKSVDDLYRKVAEEWLFDLISDGLLSVKYHSITITEEYMGTYNIRKLEICSNESSIVLEPVGGDIIGGDGRVDFFLKGEYGKGYLLILSREEKVDSWYLIDKQNKRNRSLLTKETLEGILEAWLQP